MVFSTGGWVKYAKQIEEAGADALELNVYYIPTDPNLTGSEVEQILFGCIERCENGRFPARCHETQSILQLCRQHVLAAWLMQVLTASFYSIASTNQIWIWTPWK